MPTNTPREFISMSCSPKHIASEYSCRSIIGYLLYMYMYMYSCVHNVYNSLRDTVT